MMIDLILATRIAGLALCVATTCFVGWALATYVRSDLVRFRRVERRRAPRYTGAAFSAFGGGLVMLAAAKLAVILSGQDGGPPDGKVILLYHLSGAAIQVGIILSSVALVEVARRKGKSRSVQAVKEEPPGNASTRSALLPRRRVLMWGGWTVAAVLLLAGGPYSLARKLTGGMNDCPNPAAHSVAYEDRIAARAVNEVGDEVVGVLVEVEGRLRDVEADTAEVKRGLDAIFMLLADAGYRPATRGESEPEVDE